MSKWTDFVAGLKSLRVFSKGTGAGTRFLGTPPIVRPEVNNQLLINHYRSWAYTCATKNASFVASTPLRLYATRAQGEQPSRQSARSLSRAEKMHLAKHNLKIAQSARFKSAVDVEEIIVHPFLQLLDGMNEWRDQYETFEETQLFMDITGDSYWYMSFSPMGVPEGIYVLPSQSVKIIPDKTEFIKGYLYGRNALDMQVLKPEEVIHFRTPNPRDQWYGMGCLEACFRAVEQYEAMEDYDAAMNQNMGIPGLLISYEGNLTNEQIAELEIDWNKALAGNSKAGKIKVATSKFNVHEVGKSPKDMGYLQGRKWSRDEICAAFGVPVDLVANDNSNRATSLIAFNTYMTTGILPRLRRIEDKLNVGLIPHYNEPRLFCAFDDPRQESEEAQVTNAVNLVDSKIITRNEARARFGLSPLTDEELGVGNEEQNQVDDRVSGQAAGATGGQRSGSPEGD
jgi:HK97 family phage portal protein